jgi:hypothetical protein
MTGFKRKKIENLPNLVQEKWSATVIDEGFVPFPKRLLRCLSDAFENAATLEHLRVVLSVVDYSRPNLLHPPSLGYLAFNAGLDKETFRQKLNELKTAGLVEVETDDDDAVAVSIRGLLNKIVALTAEEGPKEQLGLKK